MATIADGGTVKLGQETFITKELQPGSVIKAWLDKTGRFICATVEECAAEQKLEAEARQARLAEQDQTYEAKVQARRTAAIEANAKIKLPVTWLGTHKMVLSGLHQNSWGDGCNSRSVVHIQLGEELISGRLVRAKGDLLCSVGDHGSYGTGVEDDSCKIWQVTCKACLKAAAKIAGRTTTI